MSPLLAIGALAGLGFLLFAKNSPELNRQAGPITPGPTQPSSALLAEIVAALRSGNAQTMRALAAKLRREGFPEQAEDLERAADAIERTPENVDRPPPGSTPVTDVDVPPPGAVPVTPPPRREPPRREPIDVQEPPPGAVPVPSPTDEQRRIPPGTEQLVADYARMVYDSAPRGPVKDLALSDKFKRATNVAGDKKFYGQGPALALIRRGVVPPTPWDWQAANKAADQASYVRQLKQAKQDDPARADLWDQAIAAV